MSEWIPVVVVEDDELIRTTTERKQKLCSFQVCSAEDDPTKLQLAQEKQTVFILPDRTMPETDELETLAELKYKWEKYAAGHANSI
jgi:DNA-binding response OmpR family regulator